MFLEANRKNWLQIIISGHFNGTWDGTFSMPNLFQKLSRQLQTQEAWCCSYQRKAFFLSIVWIKVYSIWQFEGTYEIQASRRLPSRMIVLFCILYVLSWIQNRATITMKHRPEVEKWIKISILNFRTELCFLSNVHSVWKASNTILC